MSALLDYQPTEDVVAKITANLDAMREDLAVSKEQQRSTMCKTLETRGRRPRISAVRVEVNTRQPFRADIPIKYQGMMDNYLNNNSIRNLCSKKAEDYVVWYETKNPRNNEGANSLYNYLKKLL